MIARRRSAAAVPKTRHPAVLDACRRALSTRARRRLAAVTVFLGVLATVALATAIPESERTFTAIAAPTQLLMSLTAPFFGALLASDLRRSRTLRMGPTVVAGVGVAVVVAATGIVAATFGTVTTSSTAGQGRWADAGMVVLGAVLVQALAQLSGIGLGLLIGSPVLACAATVVVPLGMWLLLGAAEPLRPAQPWLTPFPSAQHLLSGQMTLLAWAQWLVVVVMWGSSLNAYGALARGIREARGTAHPT